MFTISKEGNYTAGLHRTNLKEIEKNLVSMYPTSITRRRNYESFLEILRTDLFKSVKSIIHSIWLDGSFCSTKENPNDIDGIVLCEIDTVDDLNLFLNLREAFHNSNEENLHQRLKRNYNDLYIAMELESAKKLLYIGRKTNNDVIICIANDAIENYHYWLGFFGKDRFNNKKAIYSIDFREELSYYE